MKIVFVTREGYGLAGARVRAYNFAKELKRRGIKTEVLSYADDLGAKDGIHEGSMSLLEKIRHNLIAYKRLSQEKNAIIVLQRVNYHSLGPLLNRIIKKNHLVLDLDDWEIRDDPRYILGFYPTSKAEYLTRKIASLSDFCIVSSNYLKDYIEQFNKNVHYIPSSVDLDLFRPNGKTRGSRGIKFVWTGTLHRIHDVENVKFIIDCFKELKEKIKSHISMDIVGDGIYFKEVASYVSNNRLEDCINLTGWIPPDEIAPYLEDVDVGLFPLIQDSRFNLSKSPTKLFEYMAAGKPTVSSCRGEAFSIVEDGKDGFLARDAGDFIDKMERLARDEALREEIGRHAREKVTKNYSLSMAGDRLFSVFVERYDGLCHER